jgi:hypothetical protein
MPSPFPGMDPFLEGHLWPDVRSALAGKVRALLTPLPRPRYTARLAISVVEDSAPESEIGIMYPDVEVLRTSAKRESLPIPSAGGVSPATLTMCCSISLPPSQRSTTRRRTSCPSTIGSRHRRPRCRRRRCDGWRDSLCGRSGFLSYWRGRFTKRPRRAARGCHGHRSLPGHPPDTRRSAGYLPQRVGVGSLRRRCPPGVP